MTHKTTITDNYILITSDEPLKEGEWCYIPFEHSIKRFGKYFADDWKKVIAHLPITDSADLRGVPLLPPLPSGEDDVDRIMDLSEKSRNVLNDVAHLCSGEDEEHIFDMGFYSGYNKAKEKYRFTEEDMRIAIRLATTSKHDATLIFFSEKGILQSLSQPKMPTSFSPNMVCHQCNGDESTDSCYCHYGSYKIVPQIINEVMQGEWIY